MGKVLPDALMRQRSLWRLSDWPELEAFAGSGAIVRIKPGFPNVCLILDQTRQTAHLMIPGRLCTHSQADFPSLPAQNQPESSGSPFHNISID